jgi:hypothetical protein
VWRNWSQRYSANAKIKRKYMRKNKNKGKGMQEFSGGDENVSIFDVHMFYTLTLSDIHVYVFVKTHDMVLKFAHFSV